MTLGLLDCLAAAAARGPDQPAVFAPGRKPATHGETLAAVRGVGRALRAIGLQPNSRVAVIAPDSAELAVFMLGVMSHVVAVPLSPRLTAEEIGKSVIALKADAIAFVPGTPQGTLAAAVANDKNILAIPFAADPNAPAGGVSLGVDVPMTAPLAPARSGDDHILVVPTGGTTGRPKAVPLTHNNVLSMMLTNVDVLSMSPNDRCLSIMPLCHIHGLGAVLCSLLCGGSVVVTSGFAADHFWHWLNEFECNWYTAVPTTHQAGLVAAGRFPMEVAKLKQRGGLRLVRSGSAPMPPGVPAQLEALYGATYVEASGATEASAYLCSNRPETRKIGSVGKPMPGVDLLIRSEDGKILGPNQTGELIAKGPGLFKGYENDPEQTAAAFVDGDVNGYFRTGDLGHKDEEGFVYLTGRLKEQINRGGMKVSPGEVEAAILQHPAVHQCAVFGYPDTRLGQEVGAVCTLKPGLTVSELELQRVLNGKVADYKVPRKIIFKDAIPATPLGKVQRMKLAEQLGLDKPEEAAGEWTKPNTTAEQTIAAIWEDVLDRPIYDVNSSFYALGGDSVQAVDVCLAMEQRFNRNIPLAALSSRPTIRSMAQLLADDGWKPTPGAPVVLRDGQPGGHVIYFLPGVGGNIYSFYGLAKRLPDSWRVVGLPLPGADGLEPTMDSVEAIADRYFDLIRAERPNGPYLFAGYSFGGRVAFEMTKRLIEKGEPVLPLVMLDTAEPSWPPPLPLLQRAAMLAKKKTKHFLTGGDPAKKAKAEKAANAAQARMAVDATKVDTTAGSNTKANIDVALKRVDNAKIRAIQDALEIACTAASKLWKPTPLPIKIELLKAEQHVWTDADVSDLTMGWSPLASRGVSVQMIPGNHGTIFNEPNVGIVADKLKNVLQQIAK